MDRDTFVNLGDMLAGTTVLATVANFLPPIAAALAIVWTLIRIYEWYRFRILGKTGDVFK